MNSALKMILIVAGVLLLVFGLYHVIVPEASVDLGILQVEAQNNSNSHYIAIGVGLVLIVIGALMGRKR